VPLEGEEEDSELIRAARRYAHVGALLQDVLHASSSSSSAEPLLLEPWAPLAEVEEGVGGVGGEAKVAGEGEKRKRGERGGRRVKEQKQKDELQQVATASSGSGGEGNGGGGRGTTAHYAQLNSHILDCGSTGELCELIEAHAEEFDAVNVATAFRKLLQSRRDGMPRGVVEGALQALEAAALRRMDAFEAQEVSSTLHRG
jgi:hypothetical protein